MRLRARSAFTIVELLVVIVVIAVLAAITVVSYNGITSSARESVLKDDLATAAKKLAIAKIEDGAYPTNTGALPKSEGTNYTVYTHDANTFCLQGTNTSGKTFFITESSSVTEGECPPAGPVAMQTITAASCPASRTLAYDVRDNRTYWIQKLSDNTCWMLTNLAYAGGGTATHGDTKAIQNGTHDTAASVSQPKYYTPLSAFPTASPALPSVSTDGGVTGAQRGYFYNWCAATGAQLATTGCAEASTPLPAATVSICPAGWRLPTGGYYGDGGEVEALNSAVNGGRTDSDEGLREAWLGQYGGAWASGGFGSDGLNGAYWTSTQGLSNISYGFYFNGSNTSVAYNIYKSVGMAIRCVAM